MRYSEMRTAIKDMVRLFFEDGTVFFVEEDIAEPPIPYITLAFRDLKRKQFANENVYNDVPIKTWHYDCTVDMNIYTAGRQIQGPVYANTAMEDMVDFIDFMESYDTTDMLMEKDLCMILVNGSVRDISELINDSRYRYRSYAQFVVSFTDKTEGIYGQNGKTAPNASGGGKPEYIDPETEYFETVEISYDGGNEDG